jgi:hypothetical protein
MIAVGIVAMLIIAGAAAYLILSDDGDSKGLVFASGNKDCYEPTWIADELGYYSDFGVDVEMLTVSGGGKALEALLSGQADIAGFGSTPLVTCLNLNSTDDYVVLARWMGGESYAEMASNITQKSDGYHAYSLMYPYGSTDKVTVYRNDGTSVEAYMDPIKGSRMTIGMDTTTGYLSALISYCDAVGLEAKQSGEITSGTDIEIVHLEFSLQVAALTQGEVDGIMGGSYGLAARAVSKNVILTKPDLETYPSLESEATCVLVASADAYANRYNEIVGVLKAIQKACFYIYGLEYDPDAMLTSDYIIAEQTALKDELTASEFTALFGDVAPNGMDDRGFYYRTDACRMIADFFGTPFTTEVQRISYDSYTWGLDFELVDMKIVKNSYENSQSALREVSGLDYMNYFDGRALSDALMAGSKVSLWDADKWFVDASTYFCTGYTITLDDGPSITDIDRIYVDVADGVWHIMFINEHGKDVDASDADIVLTIGGTAVEEGKGWTYDGKTLVLERIITGDVLVSVQ